MTRALPLRRGAVGDDDIPDRRDVPPLRRARDDPRRGMCRRADGDEEVQPPDQLWGAGGIARVLTGHPRTKPGVGVSSLAADRGDLKRDPSIAEDVCYDRRGVV